MRVLAGKKMLEFYCETISGLKGINVQEHLQRLRQQHIGSGTGLLKAFDRRMLKIFNMPAGKQLFARLLIPGISYNLLN